MAKEDTDVAIVLRDSNGDEIVTNAQAVIDDSIYGVNICNYTLNGNFFRENFQDDTDMELILTVKMKATGLTLVKCTLTISLQPVIFRRISGHGIGIMGKTPERSQSPISACSLMKAGAKSMIMEKK